MKEYLIALKVVKEKLAHKKSFSFEEIQNDVLEAGGILRIGVGFTLGEYITELEEDKIIEFKPDLQKFIVL